MNWAETISRQLRERCKQVGRGPGGATERSVSLAQSEAVALLDAFDAASKENQLLTAFLQEISNQVGWDATGSKDHRFAGVVKAVQGTARALLAEGKARAVAEARAAYWRVAVEVAEEEGFYRLATEGVGEEGEHYVAWKSAEAKLLQVKAVLDKLGVEP